MEMNKIIRKSAAVLLAGAIFNTTALAEELNWPQFLGAAEAQGISFGDGTTKWAYLKL